MCTVTGGFLGKIALCKCDRAWFHKAVKTEFLTSKTTSGFLLSLTFLGKVICHFQSLESLGKMNNADEIFESL